MNKPPPLNKDYHRDPNSKALKRKGFINHGSTLHNKLQFICLHTKLEGKYLGIFVAPHSFGNELSGFMGFRAYVAGLLQA